MATSGTGLLAGFASAIPEAIKGYQDMQATEQKQQEIDARAKAEKEDRQMKKAMAKLDAEKVGVELIEDENGEFTTKPRQGFLSADQKQADEMLMKGFVRDPATGGLILAPWKQKELDNKGLLQQQQQQARQQSQDYKTREERQTIIPGYKRDPNVFLDKADISNMRDAVSDSQKLAGTMTQLQNIVKNADPRDLANPLSQTNADVKNLLKDAQLTYKGEAFAKLGVLAGPDMAILDQILEDPTSAKNLARLTLDPKGKDNLLARYQGVMNRIQGGLDKKLESRGMYPSQGEERGLMQQAPDRGLLPKNAPPQAAQSQTKVINGTTYRKVQGGWEAVE